MVYGLKDDGRCEGEGEEHEGHLEHEPAKEHARPPREQRPFQAIGDAVAVCILIVVLTGDVFAEPTARPQEEERHAGRHDGEAAEAVEDGVPPRGGRLLDEQAEPD